MKRFFSGLFAALVVVLSAAPFFVRVRAQFSVAWRRYVPVLLRRFSGFPKISFPLFWKSIGMAVCIAAGQLLISVFAGFGFAKYKFPAQLPFLPLNDPHDAACAGHARADFIMLGYMNLLNTYAALILPSIIVPLGTFILTQSFKSVRTPFWMPPCWTAAACCACCFTSSRR